MKYAFVTGAARGIGLAVCKAFAAAGYAVTATYLNEESGARARSECPEVRFVRADCANEEETKRALDETPALDVLVNNAGIAHFGQVQDIPFSDYERVMNVNFGGTFLACKHGVRKLLARGGGAIVNLSSVWGEEGGSCESVYSASKGAVIAFTRALAKELAPSKITVNCVSPGVIDTDMNAKFSAGERAELCREIPLGRFGTPEEVARAVLFLAEQPYITGQTLGVKGGF